MLILGLSICCVSLVILVAMLCKRLTLNKIQWGLFGIVLISGLTLIAFGIVPPKEWDLFRHYEWLEEMNSKGLDYALNESVFAHLPIINYLYIVVAQTEVYQLLPCIVVIICYSIAFYLLKDSTGKEQGDNLYLTYAVFFHLALCPFLHMVSGIRNVLAYAICAFIFYLDVYKRRNRLLVGLLYFTTIFIHPSSIVVCCIRLAIPILLRWRWLSIFVVTWSLITDVLVKILLYLPIPFIQSIGWKLEDYLNNRVFSGYIILVVKMVFMISLLLLIEFYKYKKEFKRQDALYRYICSFEIVILAMIGSLRVEFIADRLCYFVAFAALPVLMAIGRTKETKAKYVFIIESVCIFVLLFVHQLLYFSKDLLP